MRLKHQAILSASLVTLLALGGFTPANASESRVSTLEREVERQRDRLAAGLTAFSDTVTPPAPLLGQRETRAGQPIVVAQSAADLNVRLDRAESQMRRLNGQVEELLYEMRQLKEQLRRAQEDNEFRLQRLEGGAGKKRSNAAPTQSRPRNQTAAAPRQSDTSTGNRLSSLEPRSLGEVSASGNDSTSGNFESGPLDLSALAGGLTGGLDDTGSGDQNFGQNLGVTAGSGDPQDSYDLAYGYVLTGDYDLAESGFNQFLAENPNHRLQPNAKFWLAESLFAQGRYREAANHYLEVSTKYPQDNKAPESLLKLGVSLNQLQQRQAACVTFGEMLKKYPQAPDALKRRARTERQNARCG
ncbi:tol-pal system protein YbgF [Coralliovum pocilloporae]|uniref:tol-pal system protein YbgF n=1 Tax=Coralliovum pocilloporae TaxID=3066369 RepID=UPI0033073CDB